MNSIKQIPLYFGTNQALTNPLKPGCEQQPTNMQRRVLIGGAVAALLSSPRRAMAEAKAVPNDPFIVLLKGVYLSVPVSQGPKNNLGLSMSLSKVNLNDGSYSKTQIFPVWIGIPNSENQDKAIGNFYVQLNGNLCAYDLPGGAIAMSFNSAPAGAPPGYNGFVPHLDGKGGNFLEGTFELTILEATGIYRAFHGGHNHMVDRLHQLGNGSLDEFCFCNISTYQFP
jgi:hypothetical protein